tara:strand:- start:75 stop:785 length:711 start_codon:yes stop_codon:yes gene_type:complete
MKMTAEELVASVTDHAKANVKDPIWAAYAKTRKIERELMVAGEKSTEDAITKIEKEMGKRASVKALEATAKLKSKAKKSADKAAKASEKAKAKEAKSAEAVGKKALKDAAKVEKREAREAAKAQMAEDIKNGVRRGTVIDAAAKAAYGKEANNGDIFASALKGAVTDLDTLTEIAAENGIDAARWSQLNFGMQRMNLGNVLRGMQTKHELGKGTAQVSIGGTLIGTTTAKEKKEAA